MSSDFTWLSSVYPVLYKFKSSFIVSSLENRGHDWIEWYALGKWLVRLSRFMIGHRFESE